MAQETTAELDIFQTNELSVMFHSGMQFKEYIEENNIDVNAYTANGTTLLQEALKCNKEKVVEYLLENGADPHKNSKDGRATDTYIQKNASFETKAMMRKALGTEIDHKKELKENLEFVDADDPRFSKDFLAYELDGHIIMKKGKMQSKVDEDKSEYENGNTIVINATVVHEYNHRLHDVYAGAKEDGFTGVEKVKLDACSEAIAHTAECLHTALMYQNLKKAGVEKFQYQGADGTMQEMNTDDLLSMYSPELKKCIDGLEGGFDPKNQEHIDKVAEVSCKEVWQKTRLPLYTEAGDQFDNHADSMDTLYREVQNKDYPSDKFEKTIDRMVEKVFVADGVVVNLSGCKDVLNSYSSDEAIKNVARAKGAGVLAVANLKKIEESTKSATAEDFKCLEQYMQAKTGKTVKVENSEQYFNALTKMADKDMRSFASFDKYKNDTKEATTADFIALSKYLEKQGTVVEITNKEEYFAQVSTLNADYNNYKNFAKKEKENARADAIKDFKDSMETMPSALDSNTSKATQYIADRKFNNQFKKRDEQNEQQEDAKQNEETQIAQATPYPVFKVVKNDVAR